MIMFGRKGTRVEVHVDSGLDTDNPRYIFSAEAASQETAELVKRQLQKHLGELVEAIREQAYDQGWADKREKKRAKRTEFEDGLVMYYMCGW